MMKFLNNIKISAKLTILVFAAGFLIAAVAIVGYANVNTVNHNLETLYNTNTISIEKISAAQTALVTMRGKH